VSLDVALASCMRLPEPDPDEQPLLAALRAAGAGAQSVAWDDPHADFSAARLTLLRATWNYHERPAQFLDWIGRAAACTALWNGAEVVRWNAHKRYLLELERAGVPTVPTQLVARGEAALLGEILAARGWDEVVIKPAISAGSRATLRSGRAQLARGEAHLRALTLREDALVQPYLGSVDDYGERALVWIDGEVTHAVRKAPRFAGQAESVSIVPRPSLHERALAQRALAAAPAPLLYARVDVAPGPDGAPLLMELELIEPSLFFAQSPAALARFVAAVLRRL
jgi:hypothetical protein